MSRSWVQRSGKSLCLAAALCLLIACGADEASGPETGRGGPAGEGASASDSRGGGPPSSSRSGGPPSSSRGGSRGGGPPGGFPGGFGGAPGAGGEERGVPVEVTHVARRPIASYLETHGTLEAENDVDLVARTAGPIVELAAEEGDRVTEGDLLAAIDDREIRAQLEVSKVRLEETRLAYERAKKLQASELVSQETLDQALANYQSAQGDFERFRVQLQYTEITAPFDGLIVERYVKFAEHLSNGDRLFRISDFDPLLCPIQVPERELPRLRRGQPARVEVEAWGEQAFDAKVLRISPVVDATTGTVKVTLEVQGRGRLRPGMFASVYLEMERRPDALVIPKAALALDSLGDSVFVAADGVAERRALELGFQNDDLLEVRTGLAEGEPVIVVGQDGLSEGTPVEILRTVAITGERLADADSPAGGAPSTSGAGQPARVAGSEAGGRPGAAGRPGGGRSAGGRGPGGGRGMFDFDPADPQQLERIKAFMRQRGLSDKEIEQRLERLRERRRQDGS
ncbi:MAG: efflux RND transporter periplasmic adaptor subunit [Acidobacteriota bacterium]